MKRCRVACFDVLTKGDELSVGGRTYGKVVLFVLISFLSFYHPSNLSLVSLVLHKIYEYVCVCVIWTLFCVDIYDMIQIFSPSVASLNSERLYILCICIYNSFVVWECSRGSVSGGGGGPMVWEKEKVLHWRTLQRKCCCCCCCCMFLDFPSASVEM